MNILFITIENYINFDGRSIYLDLINEFVSKGHFVTVLSACEKRDKREDSKDYYSIGKNGEVIKVNIPNVTKVDNFILKGINLLKTIPLFKKSAHKAIKNRKYDLVVYNSPPITIYRAVEYVKKKQGAKTYLLLKDIWPYDCLFGDALKMSGWKRLAFELLAYLARKLYKASDVIGCMSPANVKFLTDNEPNLDKRKIEVCPNSIKPFEIALTQVDKVSIRKKYGIPTDKIVYIYGGNLGVPQGIDFAIESVKAAEKLTDAQFVFVGGGTERKKLEKIQGLSNFQLLPAMSKDEYETLVYACDVGLIYLNNECLSPNFPSRILSYMQASKPVLCSTDVYTDIGRIAEENGFGFWCESKETGGFLKIIQRYEDILIRESMGANARRYLEKHYTVSKSYEIITSHLK